MKLPDARPGPSLAWFCWFSSGVASTPESSDALLMVDSLLGLKRGGRIGCHCARARSVPPPDCLTCVPRLRRSVSRGRGTRPMPRRWCGRRQGDCRPAKEKADSSLIWESRWEFKWGFFFKKSKVSLSNPQMIQTVLYFFLLFCSLQFLDIVTFADEMQVKKKCCEISTNNPFAWFSSVHFLQSFQACVYMLIFEILQVQIYLGDVSCCSESSPAGDYLVHCAEQSSGAWSKRYIF